MQSKSVNPHVVGIVLAGLLAALFAFLPVQIEIRGRSAEAQATEVPPTAASAAVENVYAPPAEPVVVEYTLRTLLGATPPMAYIGVGGAIDGVINPTLTANVGDTVRLTVINGDPVLHDLQITEFGVNTGELTEAEQTVTVEFVADQPGSFVYFCSIPGHQQIGMHGLLEVTGSLTVGEESELAASRGDAVTAAGHDMSAMQQPTVAPADPNAVSIVRHPADLPPPIGDRGPMTHDITMTAIEVTGQLADGTTFPYFTFDGQVPGPMLRVRQGDTVNFTLLNEDGSLFPHSIDLHAVTGPGGGAVYTQTVPGQQTGFTFQALNVGLYVYHCATASIPHHISSGMYGLILVEPPGGLPPVDREFYVMQGDIYTSQPYGTRGHLDFSMTNMSREQADYLVFNGAAGALTQDDYVLRANVGETVRIFFGVGGPNYTSSFHVIGEIFDRVYDQGALTSAPLTDVQTTLVPPGGSTMVEFRLDVPGRYILVDHALSRLERGLVGFLVVEGEDNPAIFHSNNPGEESGH